jgi:hypothetical protein
VRARLLLTFVLAIAQFRACASDPAIPSTQTILSNVVERSKRMAATTNIWVHYNRVSTTHQLDGKERIETKTKRNYWVVVGNGQTQSVLVSVNDKPIEEGEEESKRQERRREFAVTEKLIGKYDFSEPRLEELDGRKCYLLKFQPKRGLDDDGLIDKVLNRLGGTIWIDAEEFELAKLDVNLQSPASFFGGFVGSVSKIHLTARKQKVAPDFWTNTAVFIEMKGRKVISGFHFRAWETASDFTPLPDPLAAAVRK